MSKTDKFGNSYGREDREDYPGAKEGSHGQSSKETFDDLTSSEELLGGGGGIGKEIKIGLAVIALLLIVLGVVLVIRLRGPATDAANSAAPAKKSEEKQAPPTKQSGAFGARTDSGKRTAVPAVPAKGTAAGKTSTAESDDWPVASDAKTKDSRDDFRSRSGASPLFPKDSSQPASNRFAGSDANRSSARSSAGWQGDADTAPNAGTGRTADPFERQTLPGSQAGATASPPSGNVLRGGTGGLSFGRDFGSAARSDTRDAAGLLTPQSAEAGGRLGEAPRYNSSADVPTLAPRRADGSMSAGPAPARTAGSFGANDGLGTGSNLLRQPDRTTLPRRDGTYEVQPNDTLWTISEQLYGTGAYYQALNEHNRRKYPRVDRIRPGDVISTPSAEELAKLYPTLCPSPAHREALDKRAGVRTVSSRGVGGRTYVVQEGDTLFDIARQELGKAARWADIYELNRDLLGKQFDYLTPGMQLTLPNDQASPGPVTRRGETHYQR